MPSIDHLQTSTYCSRLTEPVTTTTTIVLQLQYQQQQTFFIASAVGQVNVALQLDPEEFKEKYGGDMPHQADNIVFSCLAGVRSKKALDTATSLGYKE